MEIKKFILQSYDGWFGPYPEPNTEMSQRLTVLENGRVWFSGYGFKDEIICRQIQLSIGRDQATILMNAVRDYAASYSGEVCGCDCGRWHLEIYDEKGKSGDFKGNLVDNEGCNLNLLIHKLIPIDHLFGLGLIRVNT